jgi:ParB-like chromosome segregation protein Spo0J
VSDVTPRTESQDLKDCAPFPDIVDVADEDDLPSPRARSAMREGLPPTYRMRADAHYVDQLTAPISSAREQLLDPRSIDADPIVDLAPLAPLTDSIRRHGVLQPLLVRRAGGRYRLIDGRRRLHASVAAGIQKVPCLLHEVDDAEAAAIASAANSGGHAGREGGAAPAIADWTADAGAELERTLASLKVCARMLSRSVSTFSRDAATTIIEAEVARAWSLLEATRALRSELPGARGRLALRRLVDLAVREVEPERLLHNVHLESEFHGQPEAFVAGDEQQLLLGIESAIRATFAVLEGAAAARVTVSVSAEQAARVSIAVAQNSAVAPPQWAARAFDPSWMPRPGGVMTLAGMLAVQQVAESHGGQASVEAAGRGTRIVMSLPLLR